MNARQRCGGSGGLERATSGHKGQSNESINCLYSNTSDSPPSESRLFIINWPRVDSYFLPMDYPRDVGQFHLQISQRHDTGKYLDAGALTLRIPKRGNGTRRTVSTLRVNTASTGLVAPTCARATLWTTSTSLCIVAICLPPPPPLTNALSPPFRFHAILRHSNSVTLGPAVPSNFTFGTGWQWKVSITDDVQWAKFPTEGRVYHLRL